MNKKIAKIKCNKTREKVLKVFDLAKKGNSDAQISEKLGFATSHIYGVRINYGIESGANVSARMVQSKLDKHKQEIIQLTNENYGEKNLAKKFEVSEYRMKLFKRANKIPFCSESSVIFQANKNDQKYLADIKKYAAMEMQDKEISEILKIDRKIVKNIRKRNNVKSGRYVRQERIQGMKAELVAVIKEMVKQEKNDDQIAAIASEKLNEKVGRVLVADLRKKNNIKPGGHFKSERIEKQTVDLWNEHQCSHKIAEIMGLSFRTVDKCVNSLKNRNIIKTPKRIAKKDSKQEKMKPVYLEEKRLKRMPVWMAKEIAEQRAKHGVVFKEFLK